MNFLDSIKTCLFHKYYDFSGRASRSEYWFFILFSIILGFLTSVANVISLIVQLFLILPTLAVTARRLHDINMSGWFQLLPSGLLLVSLFLLVFLPTLGLVTFLAAFGVAIFFYARRGTEGPNRFGVETYHFTEAEYKSNTLLLTLKGFFKVKDSSTVRQETQSSTISLEKKIFCPSCHQQVRSVDKFCPKCGADVRSADLICSNCKAKNSPDAKFCSSCGYKF